jgi:DNA-binding XRE family transcriptional regulator
MRKNSKTQAAIDPLSMRELAKIRREDLAARAGVSYSTICRAEKSRVWPNQILVRLALQAALAEAAREAGVPAATLDRLGMKLPGQGLAVVLGLRRGAALGVPAPEVPPPPPTPAPADLPGAAEAAASAALETAGDPRRVARVTAAMADPGRMAALAPAAPGVLTRGEVPAPVDGAAGSTAAATDARPDAADDAAEVKPTIVRAAGSAVLVGRPVVPAPRVKPGAAAGTAAVADAAVAGAASVPPGGAPGRGAGAAPDAGSQEGRSPARAEPGRRVMGRPRTGEAPVVEAGAPRRRARGVLQGTRALLPVPTWRGLQRVGQRAGLRAAENADAAAADGEAGGKAGGKNGRGVRP